MCENITTLGLIKECWSNCLMTKKTEVFAIVLLITKELDGI